MKNALELSALANPVFKRSNNIPRPVRIASGLSDGY